MNLAKLKFTAEQEDSKIRAEQAQADTGFADATQTALRNRVAGQRTLGENAIRSNLGNSGWLDRNEAEQTTEYTQERAHASLDKSQEDQARAAARSALAQGFGLEAASELAAAAGRLAEIQREEAANAAPQVESGGGGWSGTAPTGKGGGSFWGGRAPGGWPNTKKKGKK